MMVEDETAEMPELGLNVLVPVAVELVVPDAEGVLEAVELLLALVDCVATALPLPVAVPEDVSVGETVCDAEGVADPLVVPDGVAVVAAVLEGVTDDEGVILGDGTAAYG